MDEENCSPPEEMEADSSELPDSAFQKPPDNDNFKPPLLTGDKFKSPDGETNPKQPYQFMLEDAKGANSPKPNLRPLSELFPGSVLGFSQSAFSDTSSVQSLASSSENYNSYTDHLNISTDIEFTDSETETRHPICTSQNNTVVSHNINVTSIGGRLPQSKAPHPSFSPQRVPPSMSPHSTSAGSMSPSTSLHGNMSPSLHGSMSPTRSVIPDGFSDNISAILPPNSTVRVKVRSRHASFSTPPKSPADSQWRLYKVTKDMKQETFDDINGERNFTQGLTLKNAYDMKLSVSDKEEVSSQPSSSPSSPRHISPVRSLTSPARPVPPSSPARTLPGSSPRPRVEARAVHRSTTPSPSPPFTPGSVPVRCVSPGPPRPNAFTLKRKMVEPDCASPPKRPCNMGLGHRSPTVEYRARNHSPAPLSPLAVSSQSVPEGNAVRSVPIHILDRIELINEQYRAGGEEEDSSGSSDDSPPRNNRLLG